MANLFSQGFYQQFALTMDTLQPLLLTKMMKNKLATKECHLFFEATLDEPLNSSLAHNLCKKYTDIHS